MLIGIARALHRAYGSRLPLSIRGPMPVHNFEIAEKFLTLADLLEIQGANPFRVRAYRNAAQVLTALPKEAYVLLKEGQDLSELPAIGKDLARKIGTIIETGRLPLLDATRRKLGAGVVELLHVGGLGPKRVKLLCDTLHISSLEALEEALRDKRLEHVRGFGPVTRSRIEEALSHKRKKETRVKLSTAEAIAQALANHLREAPGVHDVVIAGSLRRRQETVGDIDLLVTATSASEVIERFSTYEEVAQILSKGKTRSSVRLRSNIQADLRVVSKISYGAALHYFTGSKAHNVAIRALAMKRGLKINEYGVFRAAKRIAGRSEDEVYGAVGLPYIEPELRENRGEIEAAKAGRLPKLVEIADIKGDLHCHTAATDGRSTLEEMVQAAQDRGYKYVAITDHSRRLTMTHGLTPQRLLAQIRKIDRLNETLSDFTVLKGIEVDILENGSLDLPDSVLDQLDFVVCSIHSKFDLSRHKQTERVIRAMDNPHFMVFGHPTGRRINVRDPYEIDIERILEAAKERSCAVELNAQPERLDLSDIYCKLAKEIGVKVSLGTDAHSVEELAFMKYGVGQARRGWLEPLDVINTGDAAAIRKLRSYRR